MAAWGMHLDFPPDAAGGALFPYLESMACQSFGMVIGQGGADTIDHGHGRPPGGAGGEIHLGAPVAEIDTAQGARARACGWPTGGRLDARRAVIANVHPRLLFGRLLPGERRTPTTGASLRAFRPGPGTMMIHSRAERPAGLGGGRAICSASPMCTSRPILATMARRL